MFNILITSVVLIAQPCADGVCRPAWQPRVPQTTERPHPAIVRVINDRGSERTIGSGTLVEKGADRGTVISCAHLFREYRGKISVRFASGESFEARLLDIDEEFDLSALMIATPRATAMPIAADPPRPGEALVSCGFGPDGRFAANHGQALGYVSLEGGSRDVLELTGIARQGDSGGPIINTARELAGVLFGTDGRRVDGMHCGKVREFLARQVIAKPQAMPMPKSPAPPESTSLLPPAGGFAAFEPRLAQLEQQISALRQMPTPNCPCDPTLPDRIAKLEQKRIDSPAAGVLPRAPAGAAAPGGGLRTVAQTWLSGKLTAVLVGFGLPGWIAAVTTWFVMRRGRQRIQKLADPIIVHHEARPLPQVVERDRAFVEVQVPSDRLSAIEWAMDEYVKRNPGSRPTVETIEAYAKQFQSGHASNRK